MKTPKFVKYFFAFVGLTMLTIASFVFKSSLDFIENSKVTEGIVIDLLSVQSSGSNNRSTTYAPLVQFTDNKGGQFEFVSSISSSPASYDIGENVEVIYHSKQPKEAKIKGFFAIWGLETIMGSVGAIFFCIGFALLFSDQKKKSIRKYLRQNGRRITPDYLWVELNEFYSVNNKHPYQIMAQWKNPANSEVHIFKSDNIWFDPKEFIGTEKITVLIDSKNLKRYLMDLPFLPDQKSS